MHELMSQDAFKFKGGKVLQKMDSVLGGDTLASLESFDAACESSHFTVGMQAQAIGKAVEFISVDQSNKNFLRKSCDSHFPQRFQG